MLILQRFRLFEKHYITKKCSGQYNAISSCSIYNRLTHAVKIKTEKNLFVYNFFMKLFLSDSV